MALKILLLLFCVFPLINGRVIQSPPLPQENTVENSNIKIMNQLKQTYSWGTRSQLEKAFGKTRVSKEPDEVLDGWAYTYKYKGFEVYFNNKNCEAMTVSGPEYRVLLNGQPYSVGDNIIKLKEAFPISYKNRVTGKDASVGLHITHKGVIVDAYISISYNTKGIITSIEIANDNS